MDLICWESLKSQVISIFKRADWKPTAVEAPHRSSQFLDLNWVSARNVLLANHLRCLIKLYRFVLTLEFCEIYWKPISDILEVKERRSKGLGGTTSILKSLIPQEPASVFEAKTVLLPLLGIRNMILQSPVTTLPTWTYIWRVSKQGLWVFSRKDNIWLRLIHRAALVNQTVKNLLAGLDIRIQSLGQEDPLEKG